MTNVFSGNNALSLLADVKLREDVTRGVIKTHRQKIAAGVESRPRKGAKFVSYTEAYASEIEAVTSMISEFRAKKAQREARRGK